MVRDESGEPTGLLKDNAMGLVLRAIPADPFEQTIEKARAALAHAASLGVTSLQDMTASGAELRAYQALRAAGELTARISRSRTTGSPGSGRQASERALAMTGCASEA